MNPVKPIDPEDLTLYAMDLLPAEQMQEMRASLEGNKEARKALEEIYGDLAVVACSTEMQEVPTGARARLTRQIAREKKIVAIDRVAVAPVSAEASRGTAGRVLPWLGWAVAAGMLFEVGHLYQQREQLQGAVAENQTQLAQTQMSAELANTLMETVKDPTATHVVLTGSDVKPPPQGRASYVADKGSLIFLASNLEPLQPLKTYELWLIPADGTAPIAAGTFKPDARGNASVVMPKLPKGVAAKAFGVTIEDGGGSQTPTMPIVLKGVAS